MIGKHCIITIENIQNTKILEKVEDVKPILDQIVKDCDLNVVNEAGHQFEPFGVTYVYVLSESHLSIHTYPENGTVYMDIFCCSESFDPNVALVSVENLFKNSKINFKTIDR
jgi:S-adenosylmethionine decarboxylase